MDENLQILLNSTQNIDAVNVDSNNKLELSNKRVLLHEYDIKNVLSATEVFNAEREENAVYRIYGKIEYLSLLNGLRNNYSKLEDFFIPLISGDCKTVLNSFDFYLVRATTGYTHVTGITAISTIRWIRYFEVIATPNEFELYPVGFANNVYGEQAYAFNFNEDFDVSNYFDEFGFPATELFLYAQYKKATMPIEVLSATTWSSVNGSPNRFVFNTKTLNIGDKIESNFGEKIGDLIEYSDSQFYQSQLMPQTFYISTPYIKQTITYTYINLWLFTIAIPHATTEPRTLRWKYNPFIPFRLRYFSEEVYGANVSGTSYERTTSIPSYATEYPAGTGNYVWRTIMEQGYIDPLTGIGVDYPFVNKKRYLFSNIVLDIMPDLNHAPTYDAFKHIKFGTPIQISTIPDVDDLNNIGKPC